MAPTSPGQDSGTSGPAQEPAPAGLIWTRPPTEKRERPTREAIVAAAIGLADTHGLDAVSVRRVAAALQTRPMDLYRYFARKDELIDLMVDEVIAGAVLDEIPRDWRDALVRHRPRPARGVPGPPVDGHRGRAAGPARAERHAPRRAVTRSDRRARPRLDEKASHLARRGLLHHGPRPHQPRPGSQRRQHRTRPRPARPRPRHTCRTSPARAASPTSPPSAPPACCTPSTTSSPSRPGSTGSSPASPPTAKQSPHRAAPCRPRFPGPLFARGYVRSRDCVQARLEASPWPASGCDRRLERAFSQGGTSRRCPWPPAGAGCRGPRAGCH